MLVSSVSYKRYCHGKLAVTIYKFFIGLYFDYANVICDQSFNKSLFSRIESVQYKALLAITGALKRSFPEILYQESGLEYFHQRWMRRKCLFYKVFQNRVPRYFHCLILPIKTSARQSILHKKCSPLNVQQKLSINNFFSKCDQIRSFLRIWSHLLKKSLMENFIFCAVQTHLLHFFAGRSICKTIFYISVIREAL